MLRLFELTRRDDRRKLNEIGEFGAMSRDFSELKAFAKGLMSPGSTQITLPKRINAEIRQK